MKLSSHILSALSLASLTIAAPVIQKRAPIGSFIWQWADEADVTAWKEAAPEAVSKLSEVVERAPIGSFIWQWDDAADVVAWKEAAPDAVGAAAKRSGVGDY